MLTYLSIAQYRAVLAAQAGRGRSRHQSTNAAVSGASAAVLSTFFPLDVATIEQQLTGDLTSRPLKTEDGDEDDDSMAGVALGRAVGAAVLAQAATDNYFVANPGVPPVGPGYWVSSSAPIVRSLYGTRPFFLTSASQLRPAPPPAFGSAEFKAALGEIRQISDNRTTNQTAIAQQFAWATAPFTAGNLNLIADSLITAHHRTERQAARILASANAAAFDAQIACFDAKFAYWFIRPSQADGLITMPIALPNHPSYPSGHSCITAAIMTVLGDAFPSERRSLDALITEIGLSRMYAGLHYGFDVAAGQAIGRGAAALAEAGSLK
jgi:membrane-associated phospholipid phosphatase